MRFALAQNLNQVRLMGNVIWKIRNVFIDAAYSDNVYREQGRWFIGAGRWNTWLALCRQGRQVGGVLGWGHRPPEPHIQPIQPITRNSYFGVSQI